MTPDQIHARDVALVAVARSIRPQLGQLLGEHLVGPRLLARILVDRRNTDVRWSPVLAQVALHVVRPAAGIHVVLGLDRPSVEAVNRLKASTAGSSSQALWPAHRGGGLSEETIFNAVRRQTEGT